MSKDRGGGFISVDREKALKENWGLIQKIARPANYSGKEDCRMTEIQERIKVTQEVVKRYVLTTEQYKDLAQELLEALTIALHQRDGIMVRLSFDSLTAGLAFKSTMDDQIMNALGARDTE